MTVEFLKIEEYSQAKVDFYTVRIGNKEWSEYEIFDEKEFPDHVEEYQILMEILYRIMRAGAKPHYFKFEGEASALPKVAQTVINASNNNDYGIRLYCINIHENLVILLNGGIKTKRNPLDCPNVRLFFKLANTIGHKLNKAVFNGEIDFSDNNCLDDYTIDI